MLRWLESRLLWGGLLVLAGIIFLLQNLGVLSVGSLFMALLFGLAGVFFLSVFVSNRANWWSLIPGFTLLAIGLAIALGYFAPQFSEIWSGTLILGGIALGFLAIFLLDRSNWWAMIPGGVLLTLAVIAPLESLLGGFGVAGLLFLGIGLTFAVVALTPTPEGQMRWAWIPAGILVLMGLLGLAAAQAVIGYLWPVLLILVGGILIYRTFLRR